MTHEIPPWQQHPPHEKRGHAADARHAGKLLSGSRIDWKRCHWGDPEGWCQLLRVIGYELHEAQRDALEKRWGHRIVYYLCGRRWGKTVMGAVEVLRHMIMHPNARILYLAAHLDQLDEGLGYIRRLLEPLSQMAKIPFKDSSRSTRAPKIEFGDAVLYPSVFLREGKLRGRGYTLALIDEAELMDASVFEYAILPTLGERQGELILLSTPRGSSYLLNFVKQAGGIVLNYPTWTNPMFPREELDVAWRTWNRSVFAQEYGAEIVEVAGRYFTQLPPVVPSLPEGRFLYAVGLDWGIEDPFAAVFVAKDSKGVYYVYREIYQRGLAPEAQARMVNEYLNGQEWLVADPSTWRMAPVSIAQLWFEAGLPAIQQGTRDRLASLALLRQLIAQERLHIVSGAAPNLLRELVEAQVDTKRPEDLSGEDHAIDALRYAISYLHTQQIYQPSPPALDTIADWERRATRYESLCTMGRW